MKYIHELLTFFITRTFNQIATVGFTQDHPFDHCFHEPVNENLTGTNTLLKNIPVFYQNNYSIPEARFRALQLTFTCVAQVHL